MKIIDWEIREDYLVKGNSISKKNMSITPENFADLSGMKNDVFLHLSIFFQN